MVCGNRPMLTCFHGQLYVALSRATSSSQVKVLLPQEEAGTVTKNVVYREALLTQ